jgi:hypothetical protein
MRWGDASALVSNGSVFGRSVREKNMGRFVWRYGLAGFCFLAAVWLWSSSIPAAHGQAGEDEPYSSALVGYLFSKQGQPIAGAEVKAFVDGEATPAATGESHDDGLWEVDLPRPPKQSVEIRFVHPHFRASPVDLEAEQVTQLQAGGSVNLGTIEMKNRYALGFWVATLTFVLVLGLIALETLPNATAALLGIALIF